jgi:membrane fusion protein, multidrug efflux system
LRITRRNLLAFPSLYLNAEGNRMRMRGLALILGAAVVLAAAGFGLRYSGVLTPTTAQVAAPPAGRPPSPVEVAEARTQALTDSISAIGSLVSLETAEVAADSTGRVVSVSAIDGGPVKKGDQLFELDGALLAAELQDTEARLALAETNFRRAQTLARSQTVAQSQVDQTRAELEQARSATELVRERQRRLVVRAPFDGNLGFRMVSEGAYVTAGTPLVRIDQIATLKVSLSIPERYYSNIKIGQDVTLTAEAVPGKTFRAQITAINPVVDVNGRALQILATLENADLTLRPGMLVKADILGPSRQAVTVPESAVVPQGQAATVFAVTNDQVQLRKVTTGARREGWVEIVSGLEAGVTVVVAGATRLSEGAKVKITPTAATQ